MNLIDRLIEPFSPKTALARQQARMALGVLRSAEPRMTARSYAGAARGERSRGFLSASGASANAEIGPALAYLRNRSRALVRDTAHGARIVDVWASHAIGTGITPAWRDEQVQAVWDRWVSVADAGGLLDFYGLQGLSARGMVESGETVLRLIPVPAGANGDLPPLRVQVMEGDVIDSARDGMISGRRVRLGVALGQWDYREGLYLHPDHPGEGGFSSYTAAASSFHARADVRHLFRPLRPGQVRGVPWLAPVLLAARDLADLVEATLVKANIEACFSGFYTGDDDPVPAGTTSDGTQEIRMEPGTIRRLPAGADLKFAQPTTNTQFDAVALYTLQTIASGAGLTYDQASGDLRRANYSSLRAGKIEFRRLVEQVQWHNIVPMACDPVADAFIHTAILAGLVPDRPESYARDWIMPAVEPIDPKKDLEADILAVRAGRMTPQEFIAGWGRDHRSVTRNFAAFLAEIDALGLSLDIDPRRPANGGQSPATPADPPDPAADQTGDNIDD